MPSPSGRCVSNAVLFLPYSERRQWARIQQPDRHSLSASSQDASLHARSPKLGAHSVQIVFWYSFLSAQGPQCAWKGSVNRNMEWLYRESKARPHGLCHSVSPNYDPGWPHRHLYIKCGNRHGLLGGEFSLSFYQTCYLRSPFIVGLFPNEVAGSWHRCAVCVHLLPIEPHIWSTRTFTPTLHPCRTRRTAADLRA
jgi:hypothetical protein